ncbi:hypothetical protein GCM10029992_57950 [Glycomyces albus]
MTMNRKLKKALAASAAAAMGATIAVAVSAGPAQAICHGRGGGTTAHGLNEYGQVVAWERNVSGTCDQDGIYNGQLRDPLTDGYAARVRYRDGSYNAIVAYASTNAWVDYRFYDQTGNRSAGVQVYAGPGTRPTYYLDTWGY